MAKRLFHHNTRVLEAFARIGLKHAESPVFSTALILTQVNRLLMDKALRRPTFGAKAPEKPGRKQQTARDLAQPGVGRLAGIPD